MNYYKKIKPMFVKHVILLFMLYDNESSNFIDMRNKSAQNKNTTD